MKTIARVGLLGMVAAAPLVSLANAQNGDYYSRDKYEAVLDRNWPAYDPEPIRLGGLIVRSSAEAGLTYNSNVFANDSNEVSDTIAVIGAQANAVTDWNNHEVGAQVSAVRYNYLSESDESNNDLRAELRGRLDVTRAFDIGGAVFAEQRTEQRTDFANATGIDRPIEQNIRGARVEANYRNDRFRWESALQSSSHDFQDARLSETGEEFDQDFRDHDRLTARSRLSYAVTPNVAVFGQVNYQDREYDNLQTFIQDVDGTPTQVTRSRDSENITYAAGVNFELQALFRGDIAVGHFEEDRADPNSSDTSGVSLDGRLQWFPTRLTTVTGTVGRDVVDLGLIEAASATQTRFGGRVDHELRRNIVLSAFGSYADNEYDDIDRTDEVTEYGVAARYKINKRVHTEAFVRRLDRDISGTETFGDPSYNVNLVGIGFRFYP